MTGCPFSNTRPPILGVSAVAVGPGVEVLKGVDVGAGLKPGDALGTGVRV
jgi:hypothetical protein